MEDQSDYTRLRGELEDIVLQVRSKDIPLEKCLDLFDEALKIGGKCVESIDRTDFSLIELSGDASLDDAKSPEGEAASAAPSSADSELSATAETAPATADTAPATADE